MAQLELRGFDVFCIEPEAEWLYEKIPAKLTTDKRGILANGVDQAKVTAEVPAGTVYITFYNVATGDEIKTELVDQYTNTAFILVCADTPGSILVSAGQPTQTHYNEVEVVAQ